MPSDVPEDTSNWWCDPASEYAFLGFSYEVTACQSLEVLKKEFSNIRNKYNGRYIRLYGACEQNGYYDKVVEAAWENGIGVHTLVWFGFDEDNSWERRRDDLMSSLRSNRKARFVTRVVQFGSEPLYDSVLPPAVLAAQVRKMQGDLASIHIPVTISELQYGFQKSGGAGLKAVMPVIDPIDAHMLPFLNGAATTAMASWKGIKNDIEHFWVPNAKGKKIYLTENGWPSEVVNESQKPNSKTAQASVQQERDYFDLLDSKCEYLKNVPGGGVGWFAHIYSDDQEPGYGVLDGNGKEKFPFSPRTHC